MKIIPKLLVYLLIVYWSYWLLFPRENPWIFLDGVNLIFHEAGHVIFMVLGQFMHVLGGSLTQCLIPLGIGIYFLVTRQYFSSVFCLFWLGDNFINVSVYIRDARSMSLPLLGGDSSGHDWHWILTNLNLLNYDQGIANFVWGCGLLCIIFALIAGGALLLSDLTLTD